MTAPDYPLLAVGSYETYQLAHIATFIAERLARHRRSRPGRPGRSARMDAVRDLAGAMTALDNATGTTTDGAMPLPLDQATFAAARGLVGGGPRTADVVSLRSIDQDGFAVLGHVPGLGAVGARVPTAEIADALRTHFLTRPVAELAPWAVTDRPVTSPTLPRRVDLAAFVEHLDPAAADDRAVARNLRGVDRRTDAAIRGRFSRVDLDATPVLTPPRVGAARTARRAAVRPAARLRLHRPGPAEQSAPTTSAGP